MNVLITGITGSFGHALYHQVKKVPGLRIFAGSRNPERVNFLLEDPEVVVRRFDFCDPETYRSALEDIDSLVLVRPPALAKPRKNIFPFIDECVKSGVGHILYLSVQRVPSARHIPPARIEAYIRSKTIDYTFLRPGVFMENLITRHREEIKRSSTLVVPACRGRTAMVAIRDVAAAGAQCIINPVHRNREYEIAGPRFYSWEETAAMLSAETGRTVTCNSSGTIGFFRHRRKIGDSRGTIKMLALMYRAAGREGNRPGRGEGKSGRVKSETDRVKSETGRVAGKHGRIKEKAGQTEKQSGTLERVFGINPTDLASFIRQNRDYFV